MMIGPGPYLAMHRTLLHIPEYFGPAYVMSYLLQAGLPSGVVCIILSLTLQILKALRNALPSCKMSSILQVSSADSLCKQLRPRLSPIKYWDSSGP